MKFDLTISIVLYKTNVALLRQVMDSVATCTLNYKLYLIDNSPTDELRSIGTGPKVEYIFNNKNLGFGRAHNIAMRRSVDGALYHLVLNPDVKFEAGTLEKIFEKMQGDPSIGMISPKILYPDGSIQYLCKLLPTPLDLFGRRFLGERDWVERRNKAYELRESGYNSEMNIPYLSGCFMFLRTSALKEVGFFDERIFMYIEDADLTRRIYQRYKTLFYPEAQIVHHYEKGSYKNKKLMLYNIHGASVYFFKWGWVFDPARQKINNDVKLKYLGKTS